MPVPTHTSLGNGRPDRAFNSEINQAPMSTKKSREMNVLPTSNNSSTSYTGAQQGIQHAGNTKHASNSNSNRYSTEYDGPSSSNHVKYPPPKSINYNSSSKKRYNKKSPERFNNNYRNSSSYHSAASSTHMSSSSSSSQAVPASVNTSLPAPPSATTKSLSQPSLPLPSSTHTPAPKMRQTHSVEEVVGSKSDLKPRSVSPTSKKSVELKNEIKMTSLVPSELMDDTLFKKPKRSSSSGTRRKRRRSLLDTMKGNVIFAKSIGLPSKPNPKVLEEVKLFGSVELNPRAYSPVPMKNSVVPKTVVNDAPAPAPHSTSLATVDGSSSSSKVTNVVTDAPPSAPKPLPPSTDSKPTSSASNLTIHVDAPHVPQKPSFQHNTAATNAPLPQHPHAHHHFQPSTHSVPSTSPHYTNPPLPHGQQQQHQQHHHPHPTYPSHAPPHHGPTSNVGHPSVPLPPHSSHYPNYVSNNAPVLPSSQKPYSHAPRSDVPMNTLSTPMHHNKKARSPNARRHHDHRAPSHHHTMMSSGGHHPHPHLHPLHHQHHQHPGSHVNAPHPYPHMAPPPPPSHMHMAPPPTPHPVNPNLLPNYLAPPPPTSSPSSSNHTNVPSMQPSLSPSTTSPPSSSTSSSTSSTSSSSSSSMMYPNPAMTVPSSHPHPHAHAHAHPHPHGPPVPHPHQLHPPPSAPSSQPPQNQPQLPPHHAPPHVHPSVAQSTSTSSLPLSNPGLPHLQAPPPPSSYVHPNPVAPAYPYAQHPVGLHGIPTSPGYDSYMYHTMPTMPSMAPTGGVPAAAMPSNTYYPRPSQPNAPPPPSARPVTKIKISRPDTHQEVNVSDLAKEALLERHTIAPLTPPTSSVESEAAALAKSQMQQNACKKALIIKRPAGFAEDMDEERDISPDVVSVSVITNEEKSPRSSLRSRSGSRSRSRSRSRSPSKRKRVDDDEDPEQPQQQQQQQRSLEQDAVSTSLMLETNSVTTTMNMKSVEILPSTLASEEGPSSFDEATSNDVLSSSSGKASELPIPDIVVQDLSEPIHPITYPTDVPAFCDVPSSSLDTEKGSKLEMDTPEEPTNATFNNGTTIVEYNAALSIESEADCTSNHSDMTTSPIDITSETPEPILVVEETPQTQTTVPSVPSITKPSSFPIRSITTPAPTKPIQSSVPVETGKKIIRYTMNELFQLKGMIEKQNRPFSVPVDLSVISKKDSRSGPSSSYHGSSHTNLSGYANTPMNQTRSPNYSMRTGPPSSQFPSHSLRQGFAPYQDPKLRSEGFNLPMGMGLGMGMGNKRQDSEGTRNLFSAALGSGFGQHPPQYPGASSPLANFMPAGGRVSYPQPFRGKPGMHAFPSAPHIPSGPPPGLAPTPVDKGDPNRWIPGFLKRDQSDADLTEEEKHLKYTEKQTRGLLNKISPENFDKLNTYFTEAEKYESALRSKTSMIVRKSFDEPKYASLYAKLTLSMLQYIPPLKGTPNTDDSYTKIRKAVRSMVIQACQEQFDKRPTWVEKMHPKMTEDEYEEITKIKGKVLGNMRFVAELWNYNILSPKAMMTIMSKLLVNATDPKEEDLECAIVLLTTAGPLLEKKFVEHFPTWYKQIKTIVKLPSIASRIRFLLLDLIALKENNWQKPDAAQLTKQLEDMNLLKNTSSSSSSSSSSLTSDSRSQSSSSKSTSQSKRATSPKSAKGEWTIASKSKGANSSQNSAATSESKSSTSRKDSRPSTSSQSSKASSSQKNKNRPEPPSKNPSASQTKGAIGNRFDRLAVDSSEKVEDASGEEVTAVGQGSDVNEESEESEESEAFLESESFVEPSSVTDLNSVEAEEELPLSLGNNTNGSNNAIPLIEVKGKTEDFIREWNASTDSNRRSLLIERLASLAVTMESQKECIQSVFIYVSNLKPASIPSLIDILKTLFGTNQWNANVFVSSLTDEEFIEIFEDLKIDCPALPKVFNTILQELGTFLPTEGMGLIKSKLSL